MRTAQKLIRISTRPNDWPGSGGWEFKVESTPESHATSLRTQWTIRFNW